MTWTYDPSISTDRDKVRLLIGDTDTSDQQLSDEEIAYLLTANGSVGLAGAEACEALAAKYARQVDTKNGVLSVAASQRYKAYVDKARSLRELETRYCEVFAGGLSIDAKDSLADDDDLVQPRFRRGMFKDDRRDDLYKDQ